MRNSSNRRNFYPISLVELAEKKVWCWFPCLYPDFPYRARNSLFSLEISPDFPTDRSPKKISKGLFIQLILPAMALFF